VIGDSIAEGHPGLHGRLHAGEKGAFDPNWPDQSGQLAYHLQQLVPRYRWYNHGIGSQTTVDLRARWRRDVIGEEYDPGDGRGARTLPCAASLVVIVCGINDIARPIPNETIQANMRRMAKSARRNTVKAIFLTVRPREESSDAEIERIRELDQWMCDTLPTFGAEVVDWMGWQEDAGRPGRLRRELLIDTVHPSRAGYAALARYLAQQAPGLRKPASPEKAG
jgi:lysophospholipase L1-like esterase